MKLKKVKLPKKIYKKQTLKEIKAIKKFVE